MSVSPLAAGPIVDHAVGPAAPRLQPLFSTAEQLDVVASALREKWGTEYTSWSCSSLPGAGPWEMPSRMQPGIAHSVEGYTYQLDISPGTLAISRRNYRALDVADSPADYLRDINGNILYDENGTALQLRNVDDDLEHVRGNIYQWSRASRARMARTIAELDLSEWAVSPGEFTMVTLTLPGDWERYAPTGQAFKKAVHRWRKILDREGIDGRAIWKQEFQRRGAPHMHLLMKASRDDIATQRRVRDAWIRAVDPQGTDLAKMWAAHDPKYMFDFTGDNWTDAKRIAVYFSKHAAKTLDDKEYQHIVPDAWRKADDGPGRFWGYWRLHRAVESIYISADKFVQLRRVLRKIRQARYADAQMKLMRAAGLHVSQYRLDRMKSVALTGWCGGWVMVNDGPSVAYELARAMALMYP